MWWPAIVRALVAAAAYGMGALRDLYPSDPRFRIGAQVVVGFLVLGAVLWIEYRQTVRPALHVAKVRNVIMRQFSAPLLTDLRGKGLTARMNLMVPFRPWWWLWTRRFFHIVWSEGMENQPDVSIVFPVSHGVAGECFRTRRPVFATRTQLDTQTFPKRLRDAVRDIDEVCTYPVYEPAKGERQQRGRLLGVLNLDSKKPSDPAAPRLLDSTRKAVPAVLDEKLWELAGVAAQFVS